MVQFLVNILDDLLKTRKLRTNRFFNLHNTCLSYLRKSSNFFACFDQFSCLLTPEFRGEAEQTVIGRQPNFDPLEAFQLMPPPEKIGTGDVAGLGCKHEDTF